MMYQRMLFGSKTLRPFATSSQRIVRSSSLFSAKPNTPPFVRQVSQSLNARRPSSNLVTSNAELDRGFDIMNADMTCADFLGSVWGFVIYRCVEGNDDAWNRTLRAIQNHVRDYFEHYPRKDLKNLALYHRLHVIDDKALYGASVHDIRAHFKDWVPKNLRARLPSGFACTVADLYYTDADNAPRYNFCLAVDESGLKSMGNSDMNSPLMKLISLDSNPRDMYQTMQPSLQDGSAGFDKKDGGWMNMSLNGYVETYSHLQRASGLGRFVR